MKIIIYTSNTGFPIVTVEGNDNDTAEDVAKAYKEAVKKVMKEDNNATT